MSTREGSFFRRLDIRFPWLKLVAVCLIGLLAILDLLDFTISSVTEPTKRAKIAPMSIDICNYIAFCRVPAQV